MLLSRRLGMPEPESWRARPRQVQHPLTQRLRGSSDRAVFNQIFAEEEYASLSDLKDVSLVFDLGANVGYASAYFLNRFPKARLVAVEPDNRNIEVCRLNLKPYGERVLLLHGAVWSEPTSLNLSQGAFGDGREWATQVAKPETGSAGDTQAWDVTSLIEMAATTPIDLLKVDIERAELAVFGETAKAWLPQVRNICIELHGPDCEDTFFHALADYDYELSHSGELTICRNLRPKAASRIPANPDKTPN
jgi:FkbM family methyltransferase